MKANGEHDAPWIPTNLVAGCFPLVDGHETEMLINAATEACGTSRFHAVSMKGDGTVWFIAAPSSDFAGHPDTWCPFASALKMMAEDPCPVAFTIDVKHSVHALIIDPRKDDPRDQVQLIQDARHRGEVALARAKVEDTISFGDISDCKSMEVIPWERFHPVEERIIHWTVKALLTACALAAAGSLALIFQTWTSMAMTRGQIDDANQRRALAQQEVQRTVADLTRNPVAQMLSHLDDTSQRLMDLNGWLRTYKIVVEKDGMPKRTWSATLPPGVTGDSISRLGATTEKVDPDGKTNIVGN